MFTETRPGTHRQCGTLRQVGLCSDAPLTYNSRMTTDPATLLKEALKLSPEARAALAASLLESLDDGVDEDAEAAWAAEVAKRLHELDSGAVTPIPWSEARRMILGR